MQLDRQAFVDQDPPHQAAASDPRSLTPEHNMAALGAG
jgi:hypothetical protein